MSTSVKIKLGKLGQKIGLLKEDKAPQRRELTMLLSEVAVYQPSQDASSLALILNSALVTLDGKGDPKTLIEQANKTAQGVRVSLERLKKEREEQRKREKESQPSKKELKEMKKLQKELEQALDKVVGEMDKDLGTIRLDMPDNKNSLAAAGETIRREIFAGDPNEDDREETIRESIDALKLRIDKVNLEHSKQAAWLVTTGQSQAKSAEELLKQFDQSAGGKYQGPLLRTVETIRMAITAKPADPAVLLNLFAQVAEARKAAAKDRDFVTKSHGEGVAQKNAEALRKEVDDLLRKVNEDLGYLREAQSRSHGKLSGQVEEFRQGLWEKVPSDKFAEARREALETVSELKQKIGQQRELVQAQVNEAGRRAQQALGDARLLFEDLKDKHKDADVTASDFKAIEALLGSAEERVPAKGGMPKGLTLDSVILAQQSAEQALSRLQDIDANGDKLLNFDADTKKLAKDLEARGFFAKIGGTARSMLEKYDPKSRESLEKRLKDLLKALPTMPAKSSVAAFDTLLEDAKKAVDGLTKPVDLLEKQAEPLMGKMRGLLLEWAMGEGFGGDVPQAAPKEYATALQALDAQIKLQPPVEASLQTAINDAQAAFDKFSKMSREAMLKVVGAEVKEDEKTEKANEKERSKQTKLLERLEIKFDAAKLAVEKVKGDSNGLGAAERLIEQIKADIKANKFDKLESKRNDLDARLGLLLSNPLGEANRHREELPGVILEVRSAIQSSSSGLAGVLDEIETYQAGDDEEEEAQQTVGDLLKKYIDLLGSEIGDIERAAKPITATKKVSEDERRKAREEALRILRSFRKRVQVQPMTSELLTSPFPAAKGAVAPVFRALDKLEYTLTTCI